MEWAMRAQQKAHWDASGATPRERRENERAAIEALIDYVVDLGGAGQAACDQADSLRKSLSDVLNPKWS